MNYDNVLNEFFIEVPELKEMFEKRRLARNIELNEGAYVLWGIALYPCIIQLFDDKETNKNLLKKVFDFFEKMAQCEDERVRELLMYGILEELGDDKNILENSRIFMREKTKVLSECIESFFGR